MKDLIKTYLNEYINANNLKLTEEQYEAAYNGVEGWLTSTLPDAVSDSITAAI